MKKPGKSYEVIIPFEGVYFDSSRGRQTYGGELKKFVNHAFGSALVQDRACVTVNVEDESLVSDGGRDVLFLEADGVFVSIDDAGDENDEEAVVDIEVYLGCAQFKARPERLAEWAKEFGWCIYDSEGNWRETDGLKD